MKATPPTPLSPIDHVFTGQGSYPIEFAFSYGAELDARRMLESLEGALEAFPQAASRLVRLPDGRLGLGPGAEGFAFGTAHSEAGFDAVEERSRFIDPVETVEGEPLLRVRLTRTPEGSVLGLSLSHAVADGFSYFHFLSSWSRLFRGESFPAPSHDRERLVPEGSIAEGDLTPTDVLRDAGLFWAERRPAIPRSSLGWRRYRLDRARLREILGEAQESSPLRLSHNDALCAWLWREVATGWGGDDGERAYLSCPVDHRRLLAGFPATYFGNAVVLATLELGAAELRSASLAGLAQRVRRAVAGVDGRYVQRALRAIDGLRRQRGLTAMEECHVVHPRRGLLVTNLSRLPVREVDFGGGPPVAFDILTAVPRGAVVLPAHDGLDVRVCLPPGAG